MEILNQYSSIINVIIVVILVIVAAIDIITLFKHKGKLTKDEINDLVIIADALGFKGAKEIVGFLNEENTPLGNLFKKGKDGIEITKDRAAVIKELKERILLAAEESKKTKKTEAGTADKPAKTAKTTKVAKETKKSKATKK